MSFFFHAEDCIRDSPYSLGLGDVYKGLPRQLFLATARQRLLGRPAEVADHRACPSHRQRMVAIIAGRLGPQARRILADMPEGNADPLKPAAFRP